MAVYEYKCGGCGEVFWSDKYGREGESCPDCRVHPLRRLYTFSVAKSMPAHFNESVGTYVTNPRHLADELKKKSEEATERTGIPHDFQFGDMRDKDLFGVTDEGLEATYNAHRPGSETRQTIARQF